jgi:hypothetical protein
MTIIESNHLKTFQRDSSSFRLSAGSIYRALDFVNTNQAHFPHVEAHVDVRIRALIRVIM